MPTRLLPVDSARALRQLRWWLVFALVLLWVAGMRHHLVWGRSSSYVWLSKALNLGEGVLLCAFAGIAGHAWWRALALLDRHEVDLVRLCKLSIPVLVVAGLVPCFLTTDPVDYVLRGRIMAVHGGNPYSDVGSQYPHDPFVAFGDLGWKDMPLPYGPVIANLQAGIAWLTHQLPLSPRLDLLAALALFKAVFAGALVACALLAARIAAWLRPGRSSWAFVAVLWNPLLLNDCLANAHNDSLVLLCVLLATLAAIMTRFGVMVVAIVVGAMTKIVPVVLGPPLFVQALRRGKPSQLLLGALLSALLVGVFYWQFFIDADFRSTLQRQSELQGASWWWAVHQLTGVSLQPLVTIGRGIVMLWIAYGCLRLWRRPEPRELVFVAASSLLLLAVFGAALFGTWYHVWWLPLGLLLGHGYLYRAAVCVSVTSSFAYLGWAAMRRFDEPAQWGIVTAGILVPLVAAMRVPQGHLHPHART